jgi:putative DNA primase/helicase
MNAEHVAQAIGAVTGKRFKRSGRQWVGPCIGHDDTDPSMIVFDGHTGVQFRCLAGACSSRDLFDRARDLGVLGESNQRAGYPTIPRPLNPANNLHNVSHETSASLRALRLFDQADPVSFSLAEQYLVLTRGLEASLINEDVRFHPRCPRGAAPDTQFVPAIVVLMREHESSKPRAIQRIFLDRDARKDGKPMMLGPAGGCAMKVTSHAQTFWDELSWCPVLHIAEGYETALAACAAGYSPIWALGSAGAISTFPVLFGVGGLVVCSDNDPPGIKAALLCCERWSDAGLPAAMVRRAELLKDFADD